MKKTTLVFISLVYILNTVLAQSIDRSNYLVTQSWQQASDKFTVTHSDSVEAILYFDGYIFCVTKKNDISSCMECKFYNTDDIYNVPVYECITPLNEDILVTVFNDVIQVSISWNDSLYIFTELKQFYLDDNKQNPNIEFSSPSRKHDTGL